jgi:hypothetical protein
VRGRRITALAATVLLAFAAAGCGSDESLAPQVPGPPAEVKVPQAAQAPGDAAAAQNGAADNNTSTDSTTETDSSDSASGDATATPAPATGTGTDESGGTAAPDATADGPTNDTPPPDGSNAQQFEDFCAQNPGAC